PYTYVNRREMTKLLAWLGGALFVLSLALTSWWYFVALGRPQPGGGPLALSFDALLVTAFALHHSVFARQSVKTRLTIVPQAMQRSFYVWIASALLISVVLVWRPIGGEIYHAIGPRAFGHAIVQAVGLVLIARAAAGLDPLELAGIRQIAHA